MARGGARFGRDGGVTVRILVSAHAAATLRSQVGAGFELVTPGDPGAADPDIAFVSRDVTGLSTKHDVKPETQAFYDLLLGARKLRWVHIHSAGTDRPVYVELKRRGVEVSNSTGVNAPVVAQTAVMGVLALARHLPKLMAQQRERKWVSLMAAPLPRDLAGQRAVIVGWGPIGREIGRLLEAIGLRVTVVRSEPAGALEAALPGADWLVLACPLTTGTRRMVGAGQLALLPAHAHLVNVARGEVVDEAALVQALGSDRLAGAFLDVFEHEPLPPDSPLWSLPNVIVTPHGAGLSDGNEARVAKMFREKLEERAEP